MKKVWLSIVLLFSSASYAQEETDSDWKIMPSISVTKLFSVGNRDRYYEIQPLMYPPMNSFRYSDGDRFSATGVMFSARFSTGNSNRSR